MSRNHSVKSSEIRISIGLELGPKIYFATFLGLCQTTVGGDFGGIGALSMGAGRRMYGLSPTSVVRFEKSGDGGATSFVSSLLVVALSRQLIPSRFVLRFAGYCW